MINFNALFTEIGHSGGLINAINAFRGTTVPNMVGVLANSYIGNQPLIDALYSNLSSFQSTPSGFLNSLQQLTQNTVVSYVTADVTLLNASIANCLSQLIAEMTTWGQSVYPNTITHTVVPNPTNAGNAALVATKRTPTGLVAENCFPETFTGTCVSDANYPPSAIAGSESVSFVGQPSIGDKLNWAYPGGSGATVAITAVNAAISNGGGVNNWLNNSDFAKWSNNVPSNWRVLTGTPGTTIVQGAATYDATGSVLNLVGNGTEQTALYQIIGVDTTTRCIPLDRLAVNLFVSLSTIPAAGVLEVALVDGSGNVINDANGSPNLFLVPLTGGNLAPWGAAPWGTGSWGLNEGAGAWGTFLWGAIPWGYETGSPFAAVNGVFRTPAVVPSQVALRVRLSTPLSNGVTLSIDRVGMAEMTSLYQQGPAIALFSGSLNLAKGDRFALTIANNLAGVWQTLFDRLYGMKALGLILPSSVRPQIPNSMVA